MKTFMLAPCVRCGSDVFISPYSGGARGELTDYIVRCTNSKCGANWAGFGGIVDGRALTASRQYNREVKQGKVK